MNKQDKPQDKSWYKKKNYVRYKMGKYYTNKKKQEETASKEEIKPVDPNLSLADRIARAEAQTKTEGIVKSTSTTPPPTIKEEPEPKVEEKKTTAYDFGIPILTHKDPKKANKFVSQINLPPLKTLKVPEERKEMFEKWVMLLGKEHCYTWTEEDAKKWPEFPAPSKDGKVKYVKYEIGEKIPYASKYFITSRGTGKSKNMALIVLYRVYTEPEYLSTLLMRHWDDHLKLSRTYYEGVLDNFCEFAFGHEAFEERMKWAIRDQQRKNWDSYYRAIEFMGRERVFFINLYHPSESKKANEPHAEVFYEEAMPTKEQRQKSILGDKGFLPNEESNYSLIFRSCDRDTGKTTKTFMGNPTVPWVEVWFLNKHWWEELKDFNKWYWEERKRVNTLEKWLAWTWTKTYSKVLPGIGPVYLHLEKNHHKVDEFDSEDNWNWDLFATKLEDYKLLERFVNGSQPRWIFNNYICYWAKKGFYFFIHKDDEEISNKDEIIDIPERYTNHEQYFASKQRIREPIDRNDLLVEIKGWWDAGILRFKGMNARDVIMEFLTSQPVKIKSPFTNLKWM